MLTCWISIMSIVDQFWQNDYRSVPYRNRQKPQNSERHFFVNIDLNGHYLISSLMWTFFSVRVIGVSDGISAIWSLYLSIAHYRDRAKLHPWIYLKFVCNLRSAQRFLGVFIVHHAPEPLPTPVKGKLLNSPNKNWHRTAPYAFFAPA